MRVKDSQKQAALQGATVRVVNEIGFAASSVSKIAKAAKVSPATLYTYFENKDELIVSTYLAVMDRMSAAIFRNLSPELKVKDALLTVWRATFRYIQEQREEFLYTEQFAKSPYMQRLKLEDVKAIYGPLIAVLRQGMEQKLLKDVHIHFHILYFLYPATTLANPGCCHTMPIQEETIETAFRMTWDAIKR